MKKDLLFDVEDKPKIGQLFVFALQQLLAIITATIAVPTIIGLPMQIPAALLGAGVGTIVYLLFTRFKSPVFLGSSFAFLSSLGVATAYGYCGIIVGSMFAGLVYIVIAIIIRFVGTRWVSNLMPPVIIGPTVAIIGLSLAGNAMGDMVKASGALNVAAGNVYGSYNLIALLCGLIAFFTIIILSTQKKIKMLRLIPFIIGICTGYLAAAVFTAIGAVAKIDYLMIINFGPLVENFVVDGKFVGITAFLDYPHFSLIEAIKELSSGKAGIAKASMINAAGIAEVAIAFLPVAFVVFAEHIADHKNLGSIIGRDLVEGEPGLSRTLLGDGVGSIAGTVFGICPNTTYGESVGCVAITKNASIYTILVAACMCIVLSFISPLMALLRTIPAAVMGGVCLTLYGFIAVSGLKMIKDVDLSKNKNLFVVAAILIAGIGGLAIKIPYALDAITGEVEKTITVTSIATALILGIVTNLILTKIEKYNAQQGLDDDEADTADASENATAEVASEAAVTDATTADDTLKTAE